MRNSILNINSDIDVVIKKVDLSVLENVYMLYNDLKNYKLITWLNNAGFGYYGDCGSKNLDQIYKMISLNVASLTILSNLYVEDYKMVKNAQLINVSSRGGYMLVDNSVAYCASKFFVSSFTEGLSSELKKNKFLLKAKVLAPAATKTEFGSIATNDVHYDYDLNFSRYHSAEEMADFFMKLYNSEATVGYVDVDTFQFCLSDGLLKK